jgi:meckelin
MKIYSIPLGAAFLLLSHVDGKVNHLQLPNDLKCSKKEYFDTSGLQCSVCNAPSVPSKEVDLYQNSLDCSCQTFQIESPKTCSLGEMQSGSCIEKECSSQCIDQDMSTSMDQIYCIPCGYSETDGIPIESTSVLYDKSVQDCTCNNPSLMEPESTPVRSRRLVEIYSQDLGHPLRKDCLQCPKGTAVITQNLLQEGETTFYTAGARFQPNPHICAICPDPNMYFDLDYQCKCFDGMVMVGEGSIGKQKCIQYMPSISSDYSKVDFHFVSQNDKQQGFSKRNVDSIIFSHYYLNAASNCEFARSSTKLVGRSCQILANLCVLTLYDTNSAPCLEFQSIIANKRMTNYHGQESWKLFMPWLYYLEDADDVVQDRSLQMKMSFWELQDYEHYMDFRLVKYSISGELIGVEKVSDQFMYCRAHDDHVKQKSNKAAWFQFGNTVRFENKCNIKSLLESEMYFYDLYLVDRGKDVCVGTELNGLCLYPVPVLVRNLADGEVFPNLNAMEGDEYNDKYTRRFFFFDNLVRIDALLRFLSILSNLSQSPISQGKQRKV